MASGARAIAMAINIAKISRKRTAALWRPCRRKATRHFGNIAVAIVDGRKRPQEPILIY
jgi:hypothetical protein